MYQVSNDYNLALSKPIRRYHIRIAVGNVVLSDENIRTGTFFVSNQCSDETQLQIGQVFVGELGAIFCNTSIGRYEWNGKELFPYFGLVLENNTVEYIPLGKFTISKAEWSAEGIKITAYDNMTKFDRGCDLTIKKTTLYKLASLACSTCSVELGTTESEFSMLPNSSEEINTYDENDISTWRDVLYWVAQSTATFATIGRDGKLYFKKFTQNVVDRIDDTSRYTGAIFSDFRTRYTGISVVDIKAKYTRYYGMPTDDALTYNLGSNPFLQFEADEVRERCCRAILTAMQAINYVPFSVTSKCNPALDLGDIVRFENGLADNNSISCVTKYTLNFHGVYEMSGSGEDPRLANGLSKSDKNLEGLMSQVDYLQSLTRSTERRYYDYKNNYVINVYDGGDRVKISDIDYTAGYGARLEYRAEVKLTCAQTDSINQSGYYVENDAIVRVFYRDLGEWRTDYYPVDVLPGGTCLLHLLYVWTAPAYQSDERNFQVFLSITGGNISIEIGDIHSYVTTSGEIDADKKNPVIAIEVDTMPTKVDYALGETLDFDGLVIAAVHEDGTRVDITSYCTYDPAEYSETTEEGRLTINVSYSNEDGNFATRFNLNVGSYALQSISVTSMPDKTMYKNGDELDYSGVIIIATYTNGMTKDVTSDCDFDPGDGDTVDTEDNSITIDVSYAEGSATAETTFSVGVVQLESIEVTSRPDKKQYHVGDQLDYDGVEITAHYSDGTTKDVTADCEFNPADKTATTKLGTVKVTVTYEENEVEAETSFNLSVVESEATIVSGREFADMVETYARRYGTGMANIKRITRSNKPAPVYDTLTVVIRPTKLSYVVGEALDYTGIRVFAEYENVDNPIEVTADCTYNPAQGTVLLQAGTTKCTVSYQFEGKTKSDSFDVTVRAQ